MNAPPAYDHGRIIRRYRMKRSIAMLLSLMMIVFMLPLTVSEAAGSNQVTVNGKTRTLDWDNIFGKDGKLEIRIRGFKKKDKGKNFGTAAVLTGGKEIRANKSKDDGKGKCTYYFNKAGWPEAIFFYPKDGTNRRIVLYKDSGVTIVSPGFTGHWKGTATSKDGGEGFPVSAELDDEGNGQFKYRRSEDNAGMLPFTGLLNAGKFSAKVANGVMPITRLNGKLKYASDTVNGSITVTYRDGEKQTFTVTLSRAAKEETQETDDMED